MWCSWVRIKYYGARTPDGYNSPAKQHDPFIFARLICLPRPFLQIESRTFATARPTFRRFWSRERTRNYRNPTDSNETNTQMVGWLGAALIWSQFFFYKMPLLLSTLTFAAQKKNSGKWIFMALFVYSVFFPMDNFNLNFHGGFLHIPFAHVCVCNRTLSPVHCP